MRMFLIGMSLGVLAGCGVMANEDSEEEKPIVDTRLLGVWETDCYKGDVEPAYTKEIYKFDPLGGFERRVSLHNDAACKDEALQHVVKGSYELLGEAERGSVAYKIDYKVQDVLMRAETDERARRLNDQQLCGKSDWRAGDDVDAEGLKCDGFDVRKGQALFDIYELEDGALYVGKPLMFFRRDDPDARPFKVDIEKPFFKK